MPLPASIAGSKLFEYLTGLFVGIAVLVVLLFLTRSDSPQRSVLPVSPDQPLTRPAPALIDFKSLTLQGQLEVLMQVSTQDRQRLTPIFNERYDRDIDKVPEDERELFFRNLAAVGFLDGSLEPSGITPPPGQPKQEASATNPQQIQTLDPSQVDPARPSMSKASGGQSLTAPLLTPIPFDPCVASPSDREQRPPNGYESDYDRAVEGYGKLTVVNGNSEDAVVIVLGSTAETPDRLVYVRAGMETTIAEIAPGRYRVEFQIGKYWDSKTETFQCALATSMFDRAETFAQKKTETDVEVNVQYSDVKLTLHKVVGGNTSTTPIDKSAFRRRQRIR